ncbi:hypothetical protein SpCBS45565_g00339 [Spizellomyces sp. 'palustris']|nr:hypothetical protein SpCBS45565_g00339 [Spizellomyces sp. 'palustris']
MHAAFLFALLVPLLPSIYAISAVPLADWNPPSLGYCAAIPAGSGTPGCLIIQNEARANSSTSLYSKANSAVMYMNLTTTDPLSGVATSSIAVFYPKVDDYSQLEIPNSWTNLTQYADTTPPEITMYLLYRNQIFPTATVKWATTANGKLVYVPSRTVVVNIENGALSSFQWYPTACTLTTCFCLDSICTEECPDANCPITVFVGWAGTDSNGDIMTSSSRDIWRFENAF